MDTTNSLITAGITTAIVSIFAAIYKLCHHCRFRSSCCGKELKIDSNLGTPPKEGFGDSKKDINIKV